ncbi:hypothetical protein NN6n1_24670 [Shinella zoogloeoides]
MARQQRLEGAAHQEALVGAVAEPGARREIMYGNADAAFVASFQFGKPLFYGATRRGTGAAGQRGHRGNGEESAGNRLPA